MLKKFFNLTSFSDRIIILSVFLFTIAAGCFTHSSFNSDLKAIVEVDGSIYGIYNLNSDEKVLDIVTDYGHNTIKISDSCLEVTYSDCPDKTEVNRKISKHGQVLVCLPHRLVISITGEKSEVDGVTY